MKAVRIHEFGGPEVLKYEDAPDPILRKDQVLVRVRACALNHLDLWARSGLKGITFPHILGSDVAGEVVESGEYITDVKPGTRVLVTTKTSHTTTIDELAGQKIVIRMETDLTTGKSTVSFQPEHLPRIESMAFTGNREMTTDGARATFSSAVRCGKR